MGKFDFEGHVIPGVLLALFGLWWTIWISHLYHQSVRRNKQFRSAAIFQWTFLPRQINHWPIEGIIKVLGSAIGIVNETHRIWLGKPMYFVSRHHATIYGSLMLSGIVDILIYHGFTLPPDMDYLSLCMAFTVEFLLFKFHLYGRTEVDILGHTLLLYSIGACVIATILDMRNRTDINRALARAYFLMLQGTWFINLGFIVYPPSWFYNWHGNEHHDLMMVTVQFAWNAMLNMIVLLAIYSSVAFFHRKASYTPEEKGLINKPQSTTSRAEYSPLTPDTDSEEVECGI